MASKRKRLTPRTARPDYSWVHGVVGALIAVVGVLVIVVVTFLSAPRARAEPAPKSPTIERIEQWLWPRRNKPMLAPVPVPTPRPQDETPPPAPPVVDSAPPPKPAPPKPPAIVIKPQPEPVLIAPQPRHPKKEPPVVAERPKPAPESSRNRLRPKSKSPQGQLTAAECPSCDKVRMGASMPCWMIVANAGSYDRRCEPHARRCITAAQYRAVKACFKK